MTKASVQRTVGFSIFSMILITLFRGMIYFDSAIVQSLMQFFIIGYGLAFLLVSLATPRYQIFNPIVLMPLIFMMYAIGPVGNLLTYSDDVVSLYLWYQLVGISAMMAGLMVLDAGENQPIRQTRENPIALQLTIMFMLILSTVSVLSELQVFGGLNQLLEVGYGADRYVQLSNSNALGGSFQWLLLTAIVWFVLSVHTMSRWGMILSGAIGLFSIYILFLIGGRSTIAYATLYFLALAFGLRKIRKNWILATLLFVGISTAQIYSIARYFLPDGFRATLQGVYRVILDSPETFLPLPQNISEFTIPAVSLLDTLKHTPAIRFYGGTYFDSVTGILPGAGRIIGMVGVNPSDWYLSKFYPSVLAIGGGRGFSPVTEGYMNFGLFGVVFQLFLWGLIAQYFYQIMIKNRTWVARFLYAGAFPIFVLDGMRIYLSSAVYKFSRIYLLPLMIYAGFHFLTTQRINGTWRILQSRKQEE